MPTKVADSALTDGRSARPALWVFVGILVAAVPVVLFGLGSYHWFFRDDFSFLSGREADDVPGLFEPHNAHWSTVPVVAFRGLYAGFGIRTYVPYQACVLALHLVACGLLRVIMRRVGVSPWVATVAAASFVFFGPGQQNIVWAFQIGFTGSLVFGLAQLVLGDHDGPIDWRDALGVLAGLLSLMSSGVGIAMALTAGMAILGRRGWKAALFHSTPLAVAYIGWWLAERPEVSPFGRPTAGVLFRWVRSAEIGVFMGLGHFQIVAVLLAVVFVVGLVIAWSRLPLAELQRRASLPTAMFIGSVVFSVLSGVGRWTNGPEFARSSRYVHIGTALALPAIAVAMDAIARRRRALLLPLLVLLIVALPANVRAFHAGVFDADYMAERERIITNVVRVPQARQVPRDLRPIPDPFMSPTLTIGWLLGAQDAGKLRPSTAEMTSEVENEMRVRLGVDQRRRGFPINCRTHRDGLDLSPAEGDVIGITKPVIVSTHDGNEITSLPVEFDSRYGQSLTVRLDGLDLRLGPKRREGSFTTCEVVSQTELLTLFVRKAVAQSRGGPLQQCRIIERSTNINPRKGEVLGFDGSIIVSAHDGARRTSPRVRYDSREGNLLTVNAAGLHLRLDASPTSGSFRLCSLG